MQRSVSREALQLRLVARQHSRHGRRCRLRLEHHHGDFVARTAAAVRTQVHNTRSTATLMRHRQRSARVGTHHSQPLLSLKVQKA